jgi:sulfite exporter TauE/SafE
MTGALLASAALIALAGTPHCAGMCGTGCAAAVRACRPRHERRAVLAVLAGRLLGYALAGALAASVLGLVRWLSFGAGWLRPAWTTVQFFIFALGLWLLWQGRLPATIEAWAERLLKPASAPPEGWSRVSLPGEMKALGIGVLWPLLPCGLLQSALLLASMASGPLEGAVLMLVFGSVSMLGLLASMTMWFNWWPQAWRLKFQGDRSALALRLTGAMLSVSAGWTLLHGLGLTTQAAWCA